GRSRSEERNARQRCRSADRAVPEKRPDDPGSRRLRAAARAPLRCVPDRHWRVQEDERRVRAHVRRPSSRAYDRAGCRSAGGRTPGRDRRRGVHSLTDAMTDVSATLAPAASAEPVGFWPTIWQALTGPHHGEYTDGP